MSSDNPADSELDPDNAARLKLNDAGLLPAVVQADGTGEVLMMAWMDTHALAYTLATRRGTYYSALRRALIKGLTSGHTQEVGVPLDDGDTFLVTVRQVGGAYTATAMLRRRRTAVGP